MTIAQIIVSDVVTLRERGKYQGILVRFLFSIARDQWLTARIDKSRELLLRCQMELVLLLEVRLHLSLRILGMASMCLNS